MVKLFKIFGDSQAGHGKPAAEFYSQAVANMLQEVWLETLPHIFVLFLLSFPSSIASNIFRVTNPLFMEGCI